MQGQCLSVVVEDLKAYMISAGVAMLSDAVEDDVTIAPRDEGIDETVAALVSEVGVGEAETAEVGRVVAE